MLWTIVGTDVVVATFVGGLAFHYYDVAAVQGVPRAAADAMVQPIGVASAASNLAVGVALRWVTPRAVMLFMLATTAGTLALSLRLHVPLLPLYGILVGLAQGSKDALQANALTYCYGRREVGAIAGLGAGFSLVGAAIGPTLFAITRDGSGSYPPVAVAGVVLAVCAASAALTVTAPAPAPPSPSGSGPRGPAPGGTAPPP